MQLCPASVAQAPLTALEAWLGAALNAAAGALFVVGSYTILAGMYGSFAPQRALLGPQARTLNFWGSASYLLVKLCLAPSSLYVPSPQAGTMFDLLIHSYFVTLLPKAVQQPPCSVFLERLTIKVITFLYPVSSINTTAEQVACCL